MSSLVRQYFDMTPRPSLLRPTCLAKKARTYGSNSFVGAKALTSTQKSWKASTVASLVYQFGSPSDSTGSLVRIVRCLLDDLTIYLVPHLAVNHADLQHPAYLLEHNHLLVLSLRINERLA